MKFSVCMESVFSKPDTAAFLRGMETVKAAGYEAIEFLSWWDKDVDAIKARADELGLEIAAILTKCPCMGEPGAEREFLSELEKTIEVARKLNCVRVVGQSGLSRMFLSELEFWKNMTNALRLAAPMLESAGITMIMEPVNVRTDHAGVFLSTSKDSFALTRIVNSPNIRILFDLYHQQITDGNLLETIRYNLDQIGHFHAAGCPGRNEITKGELNYGNIFRAIDKMGYDGYVGMEYKPTEDILEGLVKARALLDE